jgi:hypothetical protein
MMAGAYPTWDQEERWWRDNYSTRPYAAGRTYEEFRPAYQYGVLCATRYSGRTWDEAEADTRSGWDKFENKGPGGAKWENVKDAVKDAWNRVRGKHTVDTDKMSESEVDRLAHGGRAR